MDSIVHMRASVSEFSSDWLALVFVAPINPSKPSWVLYHPCPEYISWIFQDSSVKHYLPGIVGTIDGTGNWVWFIPCIGEFCASAQSNNFISVNLRVSLGSISKSLNTLLFLHFHILHRNHAKWWSFLSGETLQNKLSILVNSDWVENISGFNSK